MIAELLARLLPVLRPEAVGAEALLALGLVAVLLAAAALLRLARRRRVVTPPPAATSFAQLQILLRASRPDAAGHCRARAPGPSR